MNSQFVAIYNRYSGMGEYVHSLLNRTAKASMFFPLAPRPLPPLPQLLLSYDRVGGHLLQDS